MNQNIGYYYDEEIGIYTYKKGHPMRPFRVTVTNQLIKSYGMLDDLKIYD